MSARNKEVLAEARISKANDGAKLVGIVLALGALLQDEESTLQCLAIATRTCAQCAPFSGDIPIQPLPSLTGEEGHEATTGVQAGRAKIVNLTRAVMAGAILLEIASSLTGMASLDLRTSLDVAVSMIETAGNTTIHEGETTTILASPNAAEAVLPLTRPSLAKPREASHQDR